MQSSSFAILGYGRFGSALASMLRRAGHALRVYDPRADVPGEFASPNMEAAIDGADWIVLAIPVAAMAGVLANLAPLLQPGQVVMDVGSVKLHPCAKMDEILGQRIAHVGTHPLFGPISLARGDRPLRVVVCASALHPDAAARAVELYRSIDCEVAEQDPASHDRAMARTHAMAFFIAKGLLNFGIDDSLHLAPPSFQGVQRMLDAVRGDAGHLFATIERENPFAAEARTQLIAALQAVNEELQSSEDDTSLSIPEGPDPHHGG